MNHNHHHYIASSSTDLHIPRAQDWTQGLSIADGSSSSSSTSGTVWFQVLETLNRGSTIEPNFRMILADAHGETILSLAKFNRKGISPHWCIYTAIPSYVGQRASCSVTTTTTTSAGDRDQVPPNMYLYGMLYTTGEFVQCANKHDDEAIHYDYRTIRGGKTCCCRGSSRQVVVLEDASGKTVWERDQLNETMHVSKGQNLAASAALAYCLDRLIKPLGSTAERQERTRQSQRQAQIMGLGGGKGKGGFKTRTRNSSEDEHNIRVHAVEDSWHASKELVEHNNNNSSKLRTKRCEGESLLTTAKMEQCPRDHRKPRRKRQLSAAILEMDSDTSA
jgi:hypothetical protein